MSRDSQQEHVFVLPLLHHSLGLFAQDFHPLVAPPLQVLILALRGQPDDAFGYSERARLQDVMPVNIAYKKLHIAASMNIIFVQHISFKDKSQKEQKALQASLQVYNCSGHSVLHKEHVSWSSQGQRLVRSKTHLMQLS